MKSFIGKIFLLVLLGVILFIPKSSSAASMSYEAENVNNTFDDTVIFNNANCSGGKSVGWIGYGRKFTINNIAVQKDDVYKMNIYYLCGEKRNLTVTVNGEYVSTYEIPSKGNWTTIGTYVVQVPLKKGSNNICFSNEQTWAPDIDKITIEEISGGPEIKISNFDAENTITYSLPIITGSVTSGNISPKKVKISVNGGKAIEWSLGKYDKGWLFRGMAQLQTGKNIVRVQCDGCKDAYTIINYKPKQDGPGVKLVYWMSSDSNGTSYDPKKTGNTSKAAAKRRLTLMGLMAQSAYAELMYDRGYGRQTFRFEIPSDSNNGNLVFEARDSRTKAENYMDFNTLINRDIYGYVYNSLKNSGMVDDDYYKIFAFMADSCEGTINGQNISYMREVLGGGSLAIANAHSLYMCPEKVEDIDKILHNAEYSNGFAVAVGGLMHELGHTFDIGDKTDQTYDIDTGEKLNSSAKLDKMYDIQNGRIITYTNTKSGIMGGGMYDAVKIFTSLSEDGKYTYLSTGNAIWSYGETNDNPPILQNDCEILSGSNWISDSEYYKIEAESKSNTFVDTKIFDEKNFSGGKCVGWIGYGRKLFINNIRIQQDKNYKLKIYYISGERRNLKITVNGGVSSTYSIPSGGGWPNVSSYEVSVPLKKGNNSICFSNDNGWAPDIDSIIIK